MRRSYRVIGILTTDESFDGTTAEQAKELIELAVNVGVAEADFDIESFEVKVMEEDREFVG
jgi:hypothetical protein